MKRIETFTDQQILDEMRRRFGRKYCLWLDEDIENALDLKDFDVSLENVSTVWDHMGKTLHDMMCATGWDVIYQAIDETEDKLTRM